MIFLKKLNLSLTPITMTSSYNKFEKQFLIRNLHDEERLIDCYCIQGSRNQNRLVQAKRFGPVLGPDRTWTNKKLENLEPGRTRTNNIKKISEQVWPSDSDGPWIPDCVKEEMSMIGKMIWISSLVIIVGICSSIFLSFRIAKTRSRLNIVNSSPVDNKTWLILLYCLVNKQ